jgi:hypothetical protein
MPRMFAAILLLGVAGPAQAVASTQSAQVPERFADGAGPAPTIHATRGVVKSIDPTTLVISRSRNRGDITFKLRSMTHRDGRIVVGSMIAVRYREEGKDHVATAIALQRP